MEKVAASCFRRGHQIQFIRGSVVLPQRVHTVLFADIMFIEYTQTHTQIMCQVSLWIEVTVTVEVMDCSRDQ